MRVVIDVNSLARVEGHGGIRVERDGDKICRAHFEIHEGVRLIEGLIRGRLYPDVAQILSRICAICSAAHCLTSLKATERAFEVEVSSRTEMLRELLLLGGNIESHSLHLFVLALPDYLNGGSVAALSVDHLETVHLGLRLKKLGNSIQETVGGRAIHPVNPVVGGFATLPGPEALIGLHQDLQKAQADCGAALDLFASLPTADFCRSELNLAALQSAQGLGYYGGDRIAVLSKGVEQCFGVEQYRSVIREEVVPHSNAKHSFIDGQPFMVGALARLSINSRKPTEVAAAAMQRLALKLPSGSPMDNNKAQLVELVSDIERALQIVEQLLQDGPQLEEPVRVTPRAGTGSAATEAPRGLLIHSYTYDREGRVLAADVITPTAMNAAGVERHFRETIEQSEGDEGASVLQKRLEMVARAYDPCISCSVH